MPGVLVLFHCEADTGYAIGRLEPVFLEAARRVAGDPSLVHFSYTRVGEQRPRSLPANTPRVLAFDPSSARSEGRRRLGSYIRTHGIETVLAFDQPPGRPYYRDMRRAGVTHLVSYWGAPMGSPRGGWKLAVKRGLVWLGRSGPDLYVFESEGMRESGVLGRGIPERKTTVVHLGVDPSTFRPSDRPTTYAHEAFGIPESRRIIYFSGHMEERKGVAVLVRAAIELFGGMERRDAHVLILGNRPGEEVRFQQMLEGTAAENHVTFGGYRDDIPSMLQSVSVGVIASTGWDSFTISSIEISATGIPLVVSRLPGLTDAVVEGVTGRTFPVGDHAELARILDDLLSDPAARSELGAAARARVLQEFTVERQVEAMVEVLRSPS